MTPNPSSNELAGLMTIGMFSRASLLSAKVLRNYHSSGLLVPAMIDPSTGYRGYHAGQLADASVIKQLRALDLPLADIERVMSERDPAITAAIVDAHLAAMTERLASTQAIVDRLLAGAESPETLTPPRVVDVPHVDVIAVHGVVERGDYTPFLDQAFATLFSALETTGRSPAGPGGATYPPIVDEEEPVTAFLPIRLPGSPAPSGSPPVGVTIDELPARTVATATHHGSYETVGETYMQLGRWVAFNASSADEPVREWYLVSPADSENPDEFVTEIQWPIHQRPQTESDTP